MLEVGIGSGLNLPFYSGELVRHLTGIDPSRHNWNKNKVNTGNLPFAFEFIEAHAEHLPAGDDTFDTIVITFTMCTIPGIHRAFSEMRRVLKRGGKLLFCEHGRAPERSMQTWQHMVNPIWRCVSGGCNLTRDIPGIIRENGFRTAWMESGYVHKRGIGGYHYWGEAKVQSGEWNPGRCFIQPIPDE